MVRSELGPDASILHTRQAPGGLLGWFGSRQIEVTASNDLPIPSRYRPSLAKRPAPPLKPNPATRPAPPAIESTDYREAYRAALKRHEAAPESNLDKQNAAIPTADSPIRDMARELLVERGFSTRAANDLLASVATGQQHRPSTTLEQLLGNVERHLTQRIRIGGPIEAVRGTQRVVALVGPTGVGKTTTIAKLAAHFRLQEKLNVGLITVDTYRIAAVEQLRTYAEIIDLPMEVVSSPREMKAAISQLSGVDLILIDTAGRSPHDDAQLQDLQATLAAAQPHETHLVLSTVASEASLRVAAARFQVVGIDSLLLTKLDEAVAMGGLYPLLATERLPLTYFTHGQNVPHDICPASAAHLAHSMVTGEAGMPVEEQ